MHAISISAVIDRNNIEIFCILLSNRKGRSTDVSENICKYYCGV